MINAKQFLYVHKKYVLRSVTMRSKSMNTRREKNWKMFYVNAFSSLAFSSSRFSLIEKRKCFIQEDSFREWVRTTKSREEKKEVLWISSNSNRWKWFSKRGEIRFPLVLSVCLELKAKCRFGINENCIVSSSLIVLRSALFSIRIVKQLKANSFCK